MTTTAQDCQDCDNLATELAEAQHDLRDAEEDLKHAEGELEESEARHDNHEKQAYIRQGVEDVIEDVQRRIDWLAIDNTTPGVSDHEASLRVIRDALLDLLP